MTLFYCLLVTGILIVGTTVCLVEADGNDYRWRRPHLPARTPHHEPGHARGHAVAPEPELVYRANARSELVRQYAARVFERVADELGAARRAQGGRS